MKPKKSCVYTIAKNESANVTRFMDAIHAAGITDVFVLDTGSTDDTAERLKQRGANVVFRAYQPWKTMEEFDAICDDGKEPFEFDIARNYSLSVVPNLYRFCIALDLDEVLNPEIGAILEQVPEEVTRLGYLYKPDAEAKPDRVLLENRIHAREGYRWDGLVHETLITKKLFDEVAYFTDNILVAHYPAKDRARSYSPMLKVAVQRNPQDTRMNLLLARDLYNSGEIKDAVKQAIKYLSLEKLEPYECSLAHVIAAKCWKKLGDPEKELKALKWSCKVHKKRRESWVELADALRVRKLYGECLEAIKKALEIGGKENSVRPYSDPAAWGFKPLEIAMIAAYNVVEDISVALNYGRQALELAKSSPKDAQRIQVNLEQMKDA